jgi:outer membrane protein TolC
LKVVYTKRINHAQSIANSYKAKFDKGEANIIEFNKSQINLLNIKKEAELNEIEQNSLLSELIRLNGSFQIVLNDTIFQTKEIPVDFEQWYKQVEQNNPILSWLKQEIEISQKQEKLNFANGLPKFSAGFMSEKVIGQQFQGISAGISIPLWENKNAVKQAKAQTFALQSIETDNKLQFYNQLKIHHAKAINLQKSVIDYRSTLNIYDNSELLKKAFDKGEISLTDYILELTIYYNSINNLLQSEREMNKAIVQLNVYE